MSLHAICPFGAVESFMALFQYNVLISKIHESSFIIFILIAILSVLFGPVVCSYICPLGTIQEWIGKGGKKLFNKRYNTFIPQKLDKILRYARYGVLVFVVYLSTQSLKLVFLEVDPYFALFNFWSDEVTIGGLIVLAVIIISSLFIERPWCKYACPMNIDVANKTQALMSEYVVTIEKDSFGDEAIADIMEEDVHEEDEDFSGSLEINGRTTINDIINAGLSLEELEEELQLEIANVNLGFRDICEQNGLDFSIEKDKILTLVNQ